LEVNPWRIGGRIGKRSWKVALCQESVRLACLYGSLITNVIESTRSFLQCGINDVFLLFLSHQPIGLGIRSLNKERPLQIL